MNEEKKDIMAIEKRTLAEALNFLGFRYIKTKGRTGKDIYIFDRTEKFKFSLTKLMEVRDLTNNYDN